MYNKADIPTIYEQSAAAVVPGDYRQRVNAQANPKTRKDEDWLFQPELVVTAPDDNDIFIKRPLPADLNVGEPEDQAMRLLYRQQLEFAVGHNVAVHAELALGQWQRAIALRTEVISAYEVARMDSPSVEDIPRLAEAIPAVVLQNMPQKEAEQARTQLISESGCDVEIRSDYNHNGEIPF